MDINKKKGSKPKISIITLGCSKNIVDSERILAAVSPFYQYTDNPKHCNILLINTCGFIASAKSQNVQAIIDAVEIKKKFGISKLIVSGCLAERYSSQLSSQIKGVDAYFGANSVREIIEYLSPKGAETVIAGRKLLTPKHYAYLKIAEGCNHRCSFCAIPVIRGKFVSDPMEKLLDEAKSIADMGVGELNVIAQDTTAYGTDIYGSHKIPELLDKLADIPFEWIRLLYTYPTDFPTEVLDVIRERNNICNYIDIPLQHINDRILKSMLRRASGDDIRRLVETIRTKVPGIAIRSTFIVGYPGETEEEFAELMDFIRQAKLDRVGAFTYSKEEDTPSFSLDDNVPPAVKQQRLDILMTEQTKISLERNKSLIGQELKVLIDGTDGRHILGRTEFDAPEVDNSVIFSKQTQYKQGQFVRAKIKDAAEFDIFA